MDYKEVIKEFENAEERYELSDEYLADINSPTRGQLSLAGEFAYGVVYLQDNAVNILINRIKELEKENNTNLMQKAENLQNNIIALKKKQEKISCSAMDSLFENKNPKKNTKPILQYTKALQKENMIQQACSLMEQVVTLLYDAENMDNRILHGVQK